MSDLEPSGSPEPASTPAEVPEPTGSSPETPESTAPETPATPEVPDPEKPKPRGGFQRRIDELTAERHRLNAQNEQLLKILEQSKGQAPQQTQPSDAPPDINSYARYEEYLAAHARWSARQEYRVIQQETAQQTQRQQEAQRQAEQARELQETAAGWQSTVERGETKYPDFYEVVHDPSVPIHPVMVQPIVTSEIGDEIAYYLGKNKAEARRIAALTPVAMIREIGKLEATLSKTGAKSNAPQPINPLTGRKAGSDKPSPDDDMKTWIAKRNRELGRK
jgi:hypothetical protein